jgi:hypothetical protein
MSDHFIVVMPIDPAFVPSRHTQRAALALFRPMVPQADEVEIETRERIQLIDCGENFESIRCPACGLMMTIEWWQERMGEDYDGGFALRRFTMPCCRAPTTLNELRYESHRRPVTPPRSATPQAAASDSLVSGTEGRATRR